MGWDGDTHADQQLVWDSLSAEAGCAVHKKTALLVDNFFFIGSGRDIEIAGPQKYVTIVWIAHGLNE